MKMKKVVISVASAMMLTSSIGFAGEDIAPAPVVATSAWFIGVMGGYENTSADTKITNTSCNAVSNDSSSHDYGLFGVKVGYMFNFNNRVDASFETTNSDFGFWRVPYSFNYTYVADYNFSNIHPLIGFGFGKVDWRDTVLCGGTETKVNMDGTMWQGRIGALYEVSQHVDAELYYRYSQVSLDNEDFQGSGYQGTIGIDNIDRNGIFVGFNYKF